ncbi:DUF4350 domain-containing protein [Kineococcus rubinsiae]|uniref:DUF4350 domain-containing protein n=1 Tax=Kineococcus rubinsiae TaxID=2609562 RepID=UPI00143129A6|nr:DUF4350 domain-containing protein [Kineococcus rubinsiae]NIZ93083.1 DUF4350 domain-containing protein [Kineococcus rubinsiae]
MSTESPVRSPVSTGARPVRRVGRARAAWRRSRVVVVPLGLLVLLAVGLALAAPRTTRDALAPTSVAPAGSRALAQVLQAEGITVREARTFATATAAVGGGASTTLLVTAPVLLDPDRLREVGRLVAAGTDLVLVAPDAVVLDSLRLPLQVAGVDPATERTPGCDAPDAVAAGRTRAGGNLYAPGAGAGGTPTVCFGGSYARVEAAGGGTVTVLGQRDVLTNQHVDQGGAAALALRTLGARPTLVWYLPSPTDVADGGAAPLSSLVPRWVLPSAVLLLLAGLALAPWRGRRLGRLVPEPLPVVVRSVESVEGRARLYARAGARERAARALRSAALRRLRVLVRLDATAPAHDVADAVAWATGRPATELRALLLPAEPADEAALVRLAVELDALEAQLRGRPT